MIRYVGILWEPSAAACDIEARRLLGRLGQGTIRWTPAALRDGFQIYYATDPFVAQDSSAGAYPLHRGAGAVLGTLFHRSSDGSDITGRPAFDEKVSEQVVRSKGRYLTEAYWGRYVAFLFDDLQRSRYVLRDPTGGLPCFMTQRCGVTFVFSLLEDCLAAGLGPFYPSWDYLAARTCVTWRLEARETALSGISNLIAGECIEFRAAASTHHVQWNPVKFASLDPLDDPVLAREHLYRATKLCVSAWASQYSRVLLLLSGGFDSSVILGLLRTMPCRPDVRCLNRYSDGAGSDERQFARLAAEWAGSPLAELERNPHVDLRRILDARPSPLTPALVQTLELGDAEIESSRHIGAAAIFGGQFGDQLFYQCPIGLTAADHVFRHGLSRIAFNLALDAAFTEHTSVWKHLSWAVCYGLLRRPHFALDEVPARHLVSKPVLMNHSLHRRFVHPWLLSLSGIGPGKANQIATIKDPMEYYDPFHHSDAPERVFPFDSQPLIETCLRIPTYILAMGGKDRALARRAFAADIPHQIARRYSKGEMNEHYHSMIRYNLDFIRELLLDGELIQHGIIARSATEEALSDRASALRVTALELFDLVSMEAWLSSRVGTRVASAA
jgi:asparagine synthase (glutamine-hydrolysing)